MRMRERSKFDYYQTPSECVALISRKVKNAWECCAGNGVFKDVLGDRIVFMSDINPKRKDIVELDFLEAESLKGIEMVVTNPPFSLAGQIIRKAIFDFRIPALMLIRVEWLSTMRNKDLQEHCKSVEIVSNLVKFETAEGRIVNGNGTGRVAWCLFTPEKQEHKELNFLHYA